MAWIESHDTLRDHPKTIRAARMLAVSRASVIGHLHCLWWWCLKYAEDGDLSQFDPEDIAEAAGWEGDPEQFIEVLINCGPRDQAGFLERDEEGRLVVHDWEDYAGRLLEQRRLQAERSQRKRQLYNDSELTRIVRARDGDRCRYCGRTVDWKDRKSPSGGTYDHIDPEGPNSPENIVVSCRGCNSAKGRRTPEEAGMRLLPAGSGGSPAENLPDPASRSAGNPLNQTKPNPTIPNRTEPDQVETSAPDEPDADAAPEEPSGRVVTYGPEHMALAKRLRDRILENKPDAKVPAKLDAWANTIRLMVERDGRAPPRIAAVIDWCQSDEFWRANILSADKLRKQFDRLELEMSRRSRKPTPDREVPRAWQSIRSWLERHGEAVTHDTG